MSAYTLGASHERLTPGAWAGICARGFSTGTRRVVYAQQTQSASSCQTAGSPGCTGATTHRRCTRGPTCHIAQEKRARGCRNQNEKKDSSRRQRDEGSRRHRGGSPSSAAPHHRQTWTLSPSSTGAQRRTRATPQHRHSSSTSPGTCLGARGRCECEQATKKKSQGKSRPQPKPATSPSPHPRAPPHQEGSW